MYCEAPLIIDTFDDSYYLNSIIFRIDSQDTAKNTVELCLCPSFKVIERLAFLRGLSRNLNLEEDGLTLKLATYGGEPQSFTLDPPVSIRHSFDSLEEKGVLSSAVRDGIESDLRKIEKSISFSSHISSEITVAQKDLIISFVEPYMDILKEEVEDFCELANTLIATTSNTKGNGIPISSQNIIDILDELEIPETERKSDDFYICLAPVVQVYAGTANLETALLQCGEALPSKMQILARIFEAFDTVEP